MRGSQRARVVLENCPSPFAPARFCIITATEDGRTGGLPFSLRDDPVFPEAVEPVEYPLSLDEKPFFVFRVLPEKQ
jgi:hypothetical protein